MGRRVRIEAPRGPCEQLPQIRDTARVRAAQVTAIVRLEIRRKEPMPAQNALPKAGSVTLDLALDGLGLVHAGAGRHVTVGVAGVFAGRGSRGVEQTLLRHQHERSLRMLT